MIRRVLQVIPSVLAILAVTFAISRFGGDAALSSAQEGTDQATTTAIRSRYGLDRPLTVQFGIYVRNVLRGDLGNSLSQGAPVTSAIGERLGPTVLLTGSALAVSVPVGILLAVLAARRPSGVVDLGVRLSAMAGHAIPVFFLAQIAILVLVHRLGLLPLLGYTNPQTPMAGMAHVADIGYHLALPALVLALSELALITRLARSGLLSELGKDYSRTALAKGLSPWEVLTAHTLPNAILPVVTVVGTRLGFLLSGAVIIEETFSWPGIGTLLVSSARAGDRTLVLGVVLLLSLSLLAANLVTDLVYARIDPRIRYR